jgi:hypothetical protein
MQYPFASEFRMDKCISGKSSLNSLGCASHNYKEND